MERRKLLDLRFRRLHTYRRHGMQLRPESPLQPLDAVIPLLRLSGSHLTNNREDNLSRSMSVILAVLLVVIITDATTHNSALQVKYASPTRSDHAGAPRAY
jgi:hypothetical protein